MISYLRASALLGLIFVIGIGIARGSEPCGDCEKPSLAFPQASAFLATAGYPSEEYTVLLSWNERPSADGGFIYGYHIQPKTGGTPFDLYADSHGALLGPEVLAQKGIRPKTWSLRPLEKGAELPAPLARKTEPHPVPYGAVHSIPVTARVFMPSIPLDQILAEDEQAQTGPHKGALRVGVFNALPAPIQLADGDATLGAWRTLPDGGALWSARILSPTAKGQRVHFSELSLPQGAGVVVYNSDDATEAYGPYCQPYSGESDLWSATCFSDEVIVECHVPAGQDSSLVRMTVDQVIHVYKDFTSMPWHKMTAGACNLDVACYPDLTTTARGIGGIGNIANTGFLFCTGALLADTNLSSDIPYFLTANHCVSTPSGASTVEIYWLYQRDACGGTLPSPSTVPRTTGGADYLAGTDNGIGTDFALLRLRSTPPSNLTYVGWSNLLWQPGTDVTCIHHPLGDYKRISFGALTGGSTVKPASRFNEVHWLQGTTEPGSSGSPLMISSTQQIIGQLYGGGASCYYPDSPDTFGRFDVTFPLIQQWLAPADGPEDIDKTGVIDAVDIQFVVNAALSIPIAYDADVDHSGAVDAVDVQLVINASLMR